MKKILALLSGGLDSATCLLWALHTYKDVPITALIINYGQRHAVELNCAKKIANDAGVSFIEIKTDILSQIGDSALVGAGDVNNKHRGNDKLPASFVPGRNIFFLTIAAAVAYKGDFDTVMIGANEVDYSGYPDCRKEFLDTMKRALNLGLEYDLKIIAPLVYMNKVAIIKSGAELGKFDYLRENTHSCYNGVRDVLNDFGYGCGTCDSCRIRKEAYYRYLNDKKG